MKAVFGLESLTDGDFAQTIAFPIGGPFDYPTYTWQELNWDLDWFPDDGSQDFWYFCANVTNLNAPAEITEVDYSLPEPNGERWVNLGSYANYIKKQVIPLCGGALINSSDCFSTQNQTFWAHYANSGTRSYLYTTCTEYGLYQVLTLLYKPPVRRKLTLSLRYPRSRQSPVRLSSLIHSMLPTPNSGVLGLFHPANTTAFQPRQSYGESASTAAIMSRRTV